MIGAGDWPNKWPCRVFDVMHVQEVRLDSLNLMR